MNISRADLKKRIQSKIEEGYAKGGKLVEMGEVALYPDPAPSVDPTVQGSGKTIQVDSDLLRDLLNWATSADAGSIDAVVAKAEEVGAAGPLTPEHLIDLTATAQTADPSNPSCGAAAQVPQAGITSPVVPAGPVGPLSPVMASFMRRGKKVQESAGVRVKQDAQGKPIMGADGKPEMETFGDKPEDQDDHSDGYRSDGGREYGESANEIAEDDIIDSDNEAIVTPAEMGKKNPGVKPDGGQTPTGMDLGNKLNKGNKGIAEDGLDDAAGAIADGIGDAIAGEEGVEGAGEPEAAMAGIAGEEIPQVDAVVGAEPMAPVGGEGLVGQVASLEARIAELEALLGGGAEEAGEVPVGIPGIEAGEEGEEDELTIDADDAEDEDGEEKADDDDAEEGEEEDDEEAGEKPEEKEEDGEEGDEKPVDDKKLFLGGEEEKKEE